MKNRIRTLFSLLFAALYFDVEQSLQIGIFRFHILTLGRIEQCKLFHLWIRVLMGVVWTIHQIKLWIEAPSKLFCFIHEFRAVFISRFSRTFNWILSSAFELLLWNWWTNFRRDSGAYVSHAERKRMKANFSFIHPVLWPVKGTWKVNFGTSNKCWINVGTRFTWNVDDKWW